MNDPVTGPRTPGHGTTTHGHAGPPALSPAQVVRLIATRELLARVRDKVFLVSTGFFLVAIAASVAVPLVLNRDDGPPEYTVVAVGPQAVAVADAARDAGAAAADAEEAAEDDDTVGASAVPAARLTVEPVDDADAATERVRAGTADAAVTVVDDRYELVGDEGVPGEVAELVALAGNSEEVRAALADAGVRPNELARVTEALNAAPPSQRLLDPPDEDAGLASLLGAGFAALFFFTTFIFGLQIAQSVVEEKQSRVVELLVAAVPVRRLLLGKVLGISVLALVQTALVLGVALTAAAAVGETAFTSLLIDAGGWFLLFFVLGFGMFSSMWAVTGALASRQEDLQATSLPMQIVVGAPFLAAVYVTDPGPLLTTLSYVPVSAPLSMPIRLLQDDAAWWEPVLAAAGICLFALLVVRLAARLYEGGLLQTGGRVDIGRAWRAGSESASRPDSTG